MYDEADAKLIATWKESWLSAGFFPVVLTIEDEMRHPVYESYSKKLDRVPMRGNAEKQDTNMYYNRLCYLRWLAMAASGGGWMSDYDVFPLSPMLPEDSLPESEGGSRSGDPDRMPNGGDFTVFQVLPPEHGKGKGVPALMSGRAEEWTRMAINILQDGLNHPDDGLWTDFFALMDLNGTYAYRDDVMKGQQVLTGEKWTDKDCEMTTAKRAVHFSHAAFQIGKLREGEGIGDRPSIALGFLSMWHKRCPSQSGKYVQVEVELLEQ